MGMRIGYNIYDKLEEKLQKMGYIKRVPAKYNAISVGKGKFTTLKFYNFVDYLRKKGYEIGYVLDKHDFSKSYIYLLEKEDELKINEKSYVRKL